MAYPAKQFYVVGVTAKEESTYGGGGSLSVSADAHQLALDNRELLIPYAESYDGRRSFDIAARSPLALLTPGQRILEGVELPFSWKGNSSAYSGSVFPALHPWLKASGLGASFAASAWTYTPWSGGAVTSLVAALYSGAKKAPLTHGLCNWRWVAERGAACIDTFRLWALMGDPTDDAGGAEALTLVYPSLTLDPPKGDALTIQIGSWLLGDYTRVEFDLGWGDPTPRQLVSAAGFHAGWARSIEFNPVLRITMEETALVGSPFHTSSGLDPYNLRKNATKLTGSTVFVHRGNTQYNRLKTIFTQAQVSAPIVQEANGSIALVQLELRPYASTPTANDALSIVAD